MEYTPEFMLLKGIYPKRTGGNPWPRAAKQVAARLKEGVPFVELQEGTLRYYNYCRQMKLIKTPFVMQAATFYGSNTEGWTEDWEVPTVEVEEHWKDKAKRLGMTASPGDTWEVFEQRVRQAR